MNHTHLIVGNSRDYHAAAVRWALRRLGQDAIIWDGISADADGRLTVDFHGLGRLRLGDRELGWFRSVWFRRQIPFKEVDGAHPDAREFIHQELADAHLSFCASVEAMSDFVVGGERTRRAASKAHQLRVATEVGFRIPRTLISNHYPDVMRFAADTDRLLVKHFAPHYFISRSSGAIRAVGPSIVSPDDLSPEKVEVCPCIYQQYIEKKYELRVTVIGNRVYAAKLSSKAGDELLDWRPAYGSGRLDVEPFTLDEATTARISALMAQLGLHYGCIDLAMDGSGEMVFFEINPGGQFLFIEEKLRQFPLLYAFASMLSAQGPSFRMDENVGASINMDEFEASREFDEWRSVYDSNASRNPKFVTFVQ
ncbi:hypothetical protein [Frateuria sp.]|uniref:ATP-grasp domain-containing protein n=1 Tax=Frateuria sp. TaxID=2211372 RepID=UPI0017CA59FC|nr:hypothetical protein [Frateuria sp.]NUR22750.1 hypothetical protein [Frateuria sp.]